VAFTTLITPAEAAPHLGDSSWVFVDCRFTLGQPGAGRAEYEASHLAGAVYADLNADLSGPVIAGVTGRHPLPAEEVFEQTARRLGIGPQSQVVAYDESSGAMAAARMWWLLKWAGHDEVAVLDGGLAAARDAGLPLVSGVEGRPDGDFVGRFREAMTVGADQLAGHMLVDARAPERYRGENETVDPVAGHIPGALSVPFAGNVGPDGRFLPPERLQERYAGLTEPVFYCGSGVTAAHNVLAYAHAGLGTARLYPGSWSEWITDESRPVATGT
jgi:thiosulfate/3-mercaptopyruvate sulfurtransferase